MNQFPEMTTLTVVETASNALGTPHSELTPLSEAIDLDALNAVMTADSADGVTVMFNYEGLRITVYSSETAYARELEGIDDEPGDNPSYLWGGDSFK